MIDKDQFTNQMYQLGSMENIELIVCDIHTSKMHNKFFLIDDKILGTGSFNWTYNAVNENFENLIITNSRGLIQKY